MAVKLKRGYTLSDKGYKALVKSLKSRNYNQPKKYPKRYIKRIA